MKMPENIGLFWNWIGLLCCRDKYDSCCFLSYTWKKMSRCYRDGKMSSCFISWPMLPLSHMEKAQRGSKLGSSRACTQNLLQWTLLVFSWMEMREKGERNGCVEMADAFSREAFSQRMLSRSIFESFRRRLYFFRSTKCMRLFSAISYRVRERKVYKLLFRYCYRESLKLWT